MYRAKVYYHEDGVAVDAVALYTTSFYTKEEADDAFKQLLRKPYFTGGELEVNVPGIGWIIESEEETVMILARRQEHSA